MPMKDIKDKIIEDALQEKDKIIEDAKKILKTWKKIFKRISML